jgi:hypothetical protein
MFVPRGGGAPGYTLFQPAGTVVEYGPALNAHPMLLETPVPGQLAVMLYNGTSTLAGNTAGPRTHSVLLLIPDDGSAVQVLLVNSCSADACDVGFMPVTGLVEFESVIGFATPVRDSPATPMAFTLVVAPETTTCILRTSSAYNCWGVATAGCPWDQSACTARDTVPGITLCSSTCSGPADVAQARAFITNVCASRHVPAPGSGIQCRTIAGALDAPAACSGWTTTAFTAPCAAACALTSSTSSTCDLLKTQYCIENSSDADCACLAVETNPLRVRSQGNLSFPEYTCAAQAAGASQEYSLLPQCWWPTCALTSNAILTSAFNKVTAPAAYGAMCPDEYTRCIVTSQNISSSVKVNIEDNCPRQKNNMPPINCPTTASPLASPDSEMTPAQVASQYSLGTTALMAIGSQALARAANTNTPTTGLAGVHLQTTEDSPEKPAAGTAPKRRLSAAEIGYIIGGCVGGVLLLALIIVLAVHFTKQRRNS